ncbi:MAG: hypothetical protein RLZZ148_676 [Cyanobacteriota bacterium]|jgi:hypothetical protein
MRNEEQVLRLNLESLKDPELKPSQISALLGDIEILLGNTHLEVLKKVGYDLHKAKKSVEFRVKVAEKILALIEKPKAPPIYEIKPSETVLRTEFP